jgi:magnesium transporter
MAIRRKTGLLFVNDLVRRRMRLLSRILLGGRTARMAGLAPGSLVHIGDKKTEAVTIHAFDYDEKHVAEKTIADPAECKPFRDSPQVTWVEVVGLHEPKVIETLGQLFGLHPLIQEDILNTEQRPKAEVFDDYIYITLKSLTEDKETRSVGIEQVSLIVGSNYVLSFQERPCAVLDSVRERIRTGKGQVRKMGADYLAYRLIDAIVDNYFVVMENLGERSEAVEDKVLVDGHEETLHEIYVLKREIILMRKAVWPLRELIGVLQRGETNLIRKTTQVYLRDVYDHVIQAIDTVETFRDILSGLMDIYLSSISNRLNGIMKVLTMIATLFIPLTFLTGLYGMNFAWMPPKDQVWGYPAILVLMASVAIGMLVFFRRKRWL